MGTAVRPDAAKCARELADLAAVHDFYIGLLQDILGHPIPVPNEANPHGGAALSVTALQQWLDLLDLATVAPVIRDGLKDSTASGTVEALVRYFCRRASVFDSDRDKTDFTITFLYKRTVPPERQVRPEPSVDSPSEFEEQLYAILGQEDVAALPEEHRQLVREFPFVRQEAEDLRTFDELMDAGLIQRVREIKQRFGKSFYHPRVLATIAEYNVFFGQRFDELFKQTAQHIKQFAAAVQKQGASIMSRIDGDVTVQNLTEVKEDEVLSAEYGRAQQQFRKISKLKKAVDSRTKRRFASPPEPPPPPPASETERHPGVPFSQQPPTAINPTLEQSKLCAAEDSIRNFILAADPGSANIVPIRSGNLALSNAEVEAFRADHRNEKSFRADLASVLRGIVAIHTRFVEELSEYKAKQGSAYLWKPHADALTWLLTTAQKLREQSIAVLRTAEQRGLQEKIAVLTGALCKLEAHMQETAAVLQGKGT